MSKKNFCCEKLELFYNTNNEFGFNFRIVKYSGDFRDKMLMINPKISDRGFVFTSGFNTSVNDSETTRMIVNYCPFCGQNLEKQYKSNDYVQEIIK